MLDRLQRLESNIAELKRFRATTSREDIHTNRHDKWALRYGLMESIQIIIDVACHIASKQNLGSPKLYSECIELMNRFGYINAAATKKLLKMIGLRNILVHEYIEVDSEQLNALLDSVDDMKDFILAVRPYV